MTPQNKRRATKKRPEDPVKERLKEEVASELGLMDEVKEKGWGGLTSRQTGRIGGYLSGRKKMQD